MAADKQEGRLLPICVLNDDEQTRFIGQVRLRKTLIDQPLGVRSNSGVVLLDAMLKGSGLGVLPCSVGDQEQDLKRLERAAAERATRYLLAHKDMRKSTALRLMMDAVIELFAEHNYGAERQTYR